MFSLGLLLGLLGQQDSLDVRQYATLRDCNAGQKLVQLLVVPDGQLEVPGYDPGLLVVARRVTGQLEDFSGQVLHHGREVHGRAGTDAFSIVALPQQPVNTSDGELQTGTVGARLDLSLYFAAFATSGHSGL